jgi:plasmid replication initiation protein
LHIQANKETTELTGFSEILQYFMELKNGYAEYKLKAAIALTSKYSQRSAKVRALGLQSQKGAWTLNIC